MTSTNHSMKNGSSSSSSVALEPNPPRWPTSVSIIRESDDKETVKKILSSVQDAWNEEHQTFTSKEYHFSTRRRAVLLAPGSYSGEDYRFQVSYYTQLSGLGYTPDQVKIVNGAGPFVHALNQNLHPNGSSLDTFWRSGENFYQDNLTWAMSQAAPLRRVHIGNKLNLTHKYAFASGGHLANSQIDRTLDAGSQQQFLLRHCHIGGEAKGGAWSMVYSGCSGNVPQPSTGATGTAAITVADKLRVRVEKPYLALQSDGEKFELHRPFPIMKIH